MKDIQVGQYYNNISVPSESSFEVVEVNDKAVRVQEWFEGNKIDNPYLIQRKRFEKIMEFVSTLEELGFTNGEEKPEWVKKAQLKINKLNEEQGRSITTVYNSKLDCLTFIENEAEMDIEEGGENLFIRTLQKRSIENFIEWTGDNNIKPDLFKKDNPKKNRKHYVVIFEANTKDKDLYINIPNSVTIQGEIDVINWLVNNKVITKSQSNTIDEVIDMTAMSESEFESYTKDMTKDDEIISGQDAIDELHQDWSKWIKQKENKSLIDAAWKLNIIDGRDVQLNSMVANILHSKKLSPTKKQIDYMRDLLKVWDRLNGFNDGEDEFEFEGTELAYVIDNTGKVIKCMSKGMSGWAHEGIGIEWNGDYYPAGIDIDGIVYGAAVSENNKPMVDGGDEIDIIVGSEIMKPDKIKQFNLVKTKSKFDGVIAEHTSETRGMNDSIPDWAQRLIKDNQTAIDQQFIKSYKYENGEVVFEEEGHTARWNESDTRSEFPHLFEDSVPEWAQKFIDFNAEDLQKGNIDSCDYINGKVIIVSDNGDSNVSWDEEDARRDFPHLYRGVVVEDSNDKIRKIYHDLSRDEITAIIENLGYKPYKFLTSSRLYPLEFMYLGQQMSEDKFEQFQKEFKDALLNYNKEEISELFEKNFTYADFKSHMNNIHSTSDELVYIIPQGPFYQMLIKNRDGVSYEPLLNISRFYVSVPDAIDALNSFGGKTFIKSYKKSAGL